MTLREFLASFGIRSKADLYAWLNSHAQPHMSNYQIMCHFWGERIADKVMRSLEVMECHCDPKLYKYQQ